jgi:hypothetical protein
MIDRCPWFKTFSFQNWSQFSPIQATPVIFAEDSLQELRAIDTLEDLKALPGIVYRELDGADGGDLALDVAPGCRLVFRPARELIVENVSKRTDRKRVNGLIVVAVQDD